MECVKCKTKKERKGIFIAILSDNLIVPDYFICKDCVKTFIKKNKFIMRFVPDIVKDILKPFL